jgi:uncharacterized protein YprB with RNaseH-like and TPR domain
MLAFDIETEGLDHSQDDITVASVYDPDISLRKTFFFQREGYDRQANIEEFLAALDDASSLCSFNGIRFDIPFIIAVFGVGEERYSKWFKKVSTHCGVLLLQVKFTKTNLNRRLSTTLRSVNYSFRRVVG